MSRFNYFLKFDFLNNLPDVKTFFEKDFPDPLNRKEELLVLVGDPHVNPSDKIMEAYESVTVQSRFPVTLVGFMRINAKWFSNLLERDRSVEYFDILVKWGLNIVNWLRNAIDSELLYALISYGMKREPKVYFVFTPEFYENTEISLSRAHQHLVLSELEDKFTKYLIVMGLPALTDLQDIAAMTLRDWSQARVLQHRMELPPRKKIDWSRALTGRDLLILLIGGETLKNRLKDLYRMARDGFLYPMRHALRVNKGEAQRTWSHENFRFTGRNLKYTRAAKRREFSEDLKEPDLQQVMLRLFGAKEVLPKLHPESHFEIQQFDGKRICFQGPKWYVDGTDIKGKGAVELINYLSGYSPNDPSSALHELVSVFPRESVANSMLYYMRNHLSEIIKKYQSMPYAFPMLSEEKWQEAYPRLMNFCRVPKNYLELLHEKKILVADKWGNILFICDQRSGAFRLLFQGKDHPGFMEQPDRYALPFYLPGKSNRVIITENPIDAIKVKSQEFDAGVVAYGAFMPINRLLIYLENKDIAVHCERNAIIPKQLTDFLTTYNLTFTVQFAYAKDGAKK